MAYDGFYSGLSTRGSVNEILNEAIQVKDEVEAIQESVQVSESAAQAAAAEATSQADRAQTIADGITGDISGFQAELAGPTGSSLIGHEDSRVNQELDLLWASIRDITAKQVSRKISVKDEPWLAKGDFISDDTQAIRDADLWCAINGYNLYFPDGNYRCTGPITSYVDWEGNGAANLSTYNLTDDKVFMVPGQKDKLPGSNLIFDGVGSETFDINRVDEFASGRFFIKKVGRTAYRVSPGLDNLGIIANFDYKTAGGVVTLPNNDNKADIDYGVVLHNVELKNIRNVNIGGYWKKMGLMHFGIDPDNTQLTSIKTMGHVGFGVLGDQSGTNSGLNAFGCFFSANDHHSRSVDPSNEQWGRCAVFIDIPSASGVGSRNGISFIGGAITTKTNVPLELNRCGAVNFTNVVFENATQAGSGTGQGQAGGNKRFIGTTFTGDIGFLNCRLNAEQITNAGALLDTAPNANITIVGGNAGKGFENWRGNSGVRLTVTGNEQTIQFTTDPSTTTGGVRARRTSSGFFDLQINTNPVLSIAPDGMIARTHRKTTQTVVGGAITPTSETTRVTGGTVDLSTINVPVGIDRLVLFAAISTDVITLKHLTGNLRIGSDIVLRGNTFNSVVLLWNGAFWIVEGGRPT